MEQKGQKEDKNRKYHFFVDGEKYDVDESTVTGALIRAKIPEAKRGYSIFLEGHGNDPDTLINDTQTFSLDKETKHFYTSPPASFGA